MNEKNVKEVKFSRKEFESNRPKLGVSLSASVLTICLAILALVFGISVKVALIGLATGLFLSWVTWPMHYFIRMALDLGKFSFKDGS